MRYEHLVQIDDPSRPGIRRLDRVHPWPCLLLRAARPELLDLPIDTTRVLEESDALELNPSTSG